ncbi:MAG: hypothetical protein JXP73_15655 [Deltaproteobacteria bacterium]|jgi:hypothetical protein|nr:hypothetical protein [Deltaproteobacteria bacterium]
MAEKHRIIPVWFFVGGILLIYGVLILITGIAQLRSPPPTVLSELHAPVWWGGLLTLIGGLFVHLFRPKKPSSAPPEG